MKKSILIIGSLMLTLSFCVDITGQHFKRLSDVPDEISKTNPFKRFKWHYQQRAFPFDTIPYVYANKVVDKELAKIKESSNRGFLEWTSKGPAGADNTLSHHHWGIISGRVKAIAVSPVDPLTVFSGSASGGIWKTEDGGFTWEDIGRDLETLNFGAIAISPDDTDIVYAGSGEVLFLHYWGIYAGRGLFKSIDGGTSWTQINEDFGDYTHFNSIKVSPHDPDVLLAALASGNCDLGLLNNEGIWKSIDAGENWYKTIDFPYAYDVMFHPTNPDIVFSCVGGNHELSGFYISNDMGDTWELKNNGLDPFTISRMQSAISESNPEIMYSVVYDYVDSVSPGTSMAFKTVNGGDSWFQISEGINLGGNSGGWYDQGWYDLCIAIDPFDPNHVFIGNVELHETTDGETFVPVRPYGNDASGSIAHVDYHQIVYSPSDPDYIYIGCDGGVYQSIDGGQTFESRNEGLETFQFYRMDSHPTDPNIMIGGTQDNGTLMTHNGGESWTTVLQGDGMECFFDRRYPDSLVYASYQRGWLRRSKEGGDPGTFSSLKKMYGAWVTPFFPHPQVPDTFYTANDDVYKKVGYYFERLTDDLSPVLINSMAQNRINPDNMILAGGGSMNGSGLPDTVFVVMISSDGGFNWTDVTDNIPGEIRWIPRVHTHPYNENTMYIVRCGFSQGNKIYMTEDLGETWTNLSGDLPDIPCNDLFIDPENTNHLYVATDMGVYRSEDGGQTYNFEGDGMPIVPVLDFDYVKIDDIKYLRLATHGRSIYETTDLPVGSTENRLSNVFWTQASPNPFTVSTTIMFDLDQSKIVTITFYNQFGKEVDRIDQKQTAGVQQITWNAEGHPTGIYYFRLQAGERVALGKVVLVR